MNLELYLLKLFFQKEYFLKYSSFVKKEFIKDNSKELYRLFEAISDFHKNYPEKDISSCQELEAYFFSCFPIVSSKDREFIQALLSRLEVTSIDPQVAEDVLRSHIERVRATEISLLGIDVAEGRKPYLELVKASEGLLQIVTPDNVEDEFISNDLESLITTVSIPGLEWRLKCLNESLGPLRKGDFGFVYARPEAGKTTFALDQEVFMASRVEGNFLHFNNEQEGSVVMARLYQSFFAITTPELFRHLHQYKERFSKEVKGRIRLKDSAQIHRGDVERLCRIFSPKLIIIDQLDKVKGFTDDRYDLEMKQIYQWARELAKEYCPVIGICQAGATAEGKKYLTMDDADSSKTAKQGEADWILGIGQSHQEGLSNIRHFSIVKNKLLGSKNTVPEMRHAKLDVRFFPDIGRYEDIR